MKPSKLELVNNLKSQLLKVPDLVDSFSQKKPEALKGWVSWIQTSEIILKQHNHTACSRLAGLRAEIERVTLLSDKQRRSRKNRLSAAISTVNPAQEVVSDIYDSNNQIVEEVRSLIKQILIPAKEAGLINYDVSTDFSDYLETLLNNFKQHQQLSPLLSRAIASIGKYDVLRLLAEEIDLS